MSYTCYPLSPGALTISSILLDSLPLRVSAYL
nr:MAG TPA: hypothetical protein [Caudoviricetes sp.]